MFAALSLLQLWRRRELVVEMLHAYVLLPYLLLLKLLPKLATTSLHAAATVAIASAAAVANGTPIWGVFQVNHRLRYPGTGGQHASYDEQVIVLG